MSGVADYFGASVQAELYKWAAVALTLVVLCLGSYFYGRHDGKMQSLSALKTVAAHVAEQRAGNAIDATKRLGQYNVKDRALEVGIAEALDGVHQYYIDHPEIKTEVIHVPGKKDKIYVPTNGDCSSPFLNTDELQLFNVGNKRGDLDTGHSK